MITRDDFPASVKRVLAERAGQRCSNPDCRMVTSGPHVISSRSIIVGVASHICAAAPGGKRYDPIMTSEQRSAIENGIWLCSTHAKMIDSDEDMYTPELLRRWKTDHEISISRELVSSGLLSKQFVEALPQSSIQVVSKQVGLIMEPNTTPGYHRVSAVDLVQAGFRRDSLHTIMVTQDEAIRKQNYRFTKFLNSYVHERRNDVPSAWSALIAGLPVIGQDVNSQSLVTMAALAKELNPYLHGKLRKIYHDKLRSIIIGVLAEIQAFIQDAASAGGLILAISAAPPNNWKDWLGWSSWEKGRSFNIDESLLHGRWIYAFPHEVIEYNIDISKTWAGVLYDIICRLPDPDRQKGQLLQKNDFLSLIYIWCATAPQDFKPALTDIIRKPIDSSSHTLAGMYKQIKEHIDKSSN